MRLQLQRGGVGLYPLTPEDHPFLYQIAVSDRNSLLWRYHGQVPPFDVFVNQLYANAFAQFVVRRPDDGHRLGHVLTYNGDLRNRHAHVGAVMAEEAQASGHGTEALEIFIDYLFAMWDFRGLFAEVPQYIAEARPGVFDWQERMPFELTGRRPDFHYLLGRYWDDMIYYLPRARWRDLARARGEGEQDGQDPLPEP